MTSRQIEMTWRCSSCGTKTLGRFKKCQQCGNPKDGSEEYEMPADPSKAATVTEEGLLRMALAGPDWRCAYCGSDQRAPDKSCANCGASALEGEEVPDEAPPPPPVSQQRRVAPPPPARSGMSPVWIVIGFAVVMCCGGGSVLRWFKNRPHDYEARVAEVKWERVIDVSRYQARRHEGFREDIPQGATDVSSLGKREHHREDVFDHYEDERYSEEVPDGYRSESYTERVSCGENCTTTPKTCSEKCKSNKNGFATCTTSCTGGGRSCTTKYCDERRTRQIPKTRTEWRTRKVARYRSEPRYAEGFAWTAWEWAPERTVRASGTDVTVRWPDSKLNQGLSKGEQESETRRESFEVTIAYDEGQTLTFFPRDEDAFRTYPPGTKHALHIESGRYELDGAPMPLAR